MSESANPSFLERKGGHRLAYHKTDGETPGVVFLSGYMSDMTGTKATWLEGQCRARGQAFLRFDYLGHGQASGAFEDGTIGRWTADTVAALDALTKGPQILVGSSMGGWLMLLAALARPDRIAGLVGIAAAPDFTEELMWRRFSPEIRATLARDGLYREPSPYGDQPYTITRRLIEEGRDHLLLGSAIPLACPVRLLHGMADPDVPYQMSLRLAEALASEDVEVSLVKDGDHRMSAPEDLLRLGETLRALSERLSR
ncbi:alpha/beta fold hydrolase [Algihabitans albus]|uniref:alpha/beta fold hydrolase n=1 Tax=Algihabitans albus TaxID=2164067 RepID=UPI001F3B7D1B|nr:alpha/beta hydrolase [Algihabitans albus]